MAERTAEDRAAMEELLTRMYVMSEEVNVDEILREGRENPLKPDEARRLLTGVTKRLIESAKKRGDTQTLENLPKTDQEIADYVEYMMKQRK